MGYLFLTTIQKKFFNGDIVDGHNEILIYDFNSKQYSKYLEESLIINDVRTKTEGTHQILPNGDLFIDESNYGRILYFNSNGSLRWTHFKSFKQWQDLSN